MATKEIEMDNLQETQENLETFKIGELNNIKPSDTCSLASLDSDLSVPLLSKEPPIDNPLISLSEVTSLDNTTNEHSSDQIGLCYSTTEINLIDKCETVPSGDLFLGKEHQAALSSALANPLVENNEAAVKSYCSYILYVLLVISVMIIFTMISQHVKLQTKVADLEDDLMHCSHDKKYLSKKLFGATAIESDNVASTIQPTNMENSKEKITSVPKRKKKKSNKLSSRLSKAAKRQLFNYFLNSLDESEIPVEWFEQQVNIKKSMKGEMKNEIYIN